MNYKTISKSVVLALVIVATSFAAPQKGTMTDPRDGKTYKTVKIGSQTWMAENLNYKISGSYCFDNAPANCEKYGRLFTWEAAMEEACPNGWHLPTKAEFETLFDAVGRRSGTEGKMLKSISGWRDDGNGTDAFGFSALPAGGGDGDGYGDDGYYAYFWSSSEISSTSLTTNAYFMFLSYNEGRASLYSSGKLDRHSVRCLKD